MGDFNNDQGQDNQAGQQTDKPALGQFDKGTRQDKDELANAEIGKDGQQGDNLETNEKVQGDNQDR